MRKVAVFFGGKSCENEISVLTGVFIMSLLDGEKWSVLPVYVHTDGGLYTSPKIKDLEIFKQKRWEELQQIFFDGATVYAMNKKKGKIKKLAKVDVALNCCHGGLGEGGGVSALMEWNEIPFASPDLTSSGVFMDKAMTKLMMRGLGVPTVDHIRVNEADYRKRGAFLLKNIDSRLKYPVVIKPAHLGSSIGIVLAKNEAEAKEGIESAFELDDRVVIEKYLENKQDVNCAACMLHGEICVSEPELAFGEGVYSFEEKYIKKKRDGERGFMRKGGGRYALNDDLRQKIRTYTKTVYKRMNMQGAVRMDFLVADGKAYLCEVNTVPGSLAYYLFCERITDAKNFFGELLEETIEQAKNNRKKLLTTGILNTVRLGRK
ncbi:MAG: ATP-grasp domain-containing protein [Clostridia bacterium]|nr:ATP-grasp domain-containing protein [Clostridia bacterium]